ncbi:MULTISPECIES: hypothetical protein [Brevibacillus]|uniref:hypothetical protein n=1 Tax=Brevibacillus TaxID=55080 RepID=UPI000404446F|nr:MULTISPECIES: hypothetical protein [Brevibacillus]
MNTFETFDFRNPIAESDGLVRRYRARFEFLAEFIATQPQGIDHFLARITSDPFTVYPRDGTPLLSLA